MLKTYTRTPEKCPVCPDASGYRADGRPCGCCDGEGFIVVDPGYAPISIGASPYTPYPTAPWSYEYGPSGGWPRPGTICGTSNGAHV